MCCNVSEHNESGLPESWDPVVAELSRDSHHMDRLESLKNQTTDIIPHILFLILGQQQHERLGMERKSIGGSLCSFLG